MIYLVAFVSLWTQISGLIGHDGILPADQFMSAAAQQCDLQGIGLDRYYLAADVVLVQFIRRLSAFPMRGRNRAGASC